MSCNSIPSLVSCLYNLGHRYSFLLGKKTLSFCFIATIGHSINHSNAVVLPDSLAESAAWDGKMVILKEWMPTVQNGSSFLQHQFFVRVSPVDVLPLPFPFLWLHQLCNFFRCRRMVLLLSVLHF